MRWQLVWKKLVMPASDRQIQGVLVQIFGEEYRIASDSGTEEVQQVAAYVDRKMREIADKHGGHLPKAKLAVLAAMDITAELLHVMQERTMLAAKARENIDRLTRLVDERASLSSAQTTERGIPTLERLFRQPSVTDQDSPPIK